MEVKLENLIEKIKEEGVQAAKKQSGEIVGQAQKEASQILEAAKKEATQIVETAKTQAEKFKKSAESAIQHASRDTILIVKEQLKALFDRVLKKEVGQVLGPDFLKELIVKLVENLAKGQKLEILLNAQEQEKLYDMILSSLKTELKKSVTIKADTRAHKGFRIGIEGEEAYYDLTDEGIAEFIKQFLNPVLSEIFERSDG